MLLINKTMAKNPIGNNKSYKINANKLQILKLNIKT